MGFPPLSPFHLSSHDSGRKYCQTSEFLSLFSDVTIKTPCTDHKHVKVYCIEFQCAIKQTSLVLEVWHNLLVANSKDLFHLQAFTHHPLATIKLPQKQKKNPLHGRRPGLLVVTCFPSCRVHLGLCCTDSETFFAVFHGKKNQSGTMCGYSYLPPQETRFSVVS